MIRALALYSGSLASSVALRLAQEAGELEILVVYFCSPFFQGGEKVRCLAGSLFPNLPFRTYTLKREYLRIENNGLPFPCGACRAVLFEKVARMLVRHRADLIITGEVVGRGGLGPAELIRLDARSGLTGRVLRPLSARLLPPTWAEKIGLVDRDSLFDFSYDENGDERILADELGIGDGMEAESRCLLCDSVFSSRLAHLLGEGPLTVNTLRLLEFEHFYYIPPDLKVVVAVSQEEKDRLQTLFLPTDARLYLPIARSPLTLVRASWADRSPGECIAAVREASRITLAVAGFPPHHQGMVCFRFEWEDETRRLTAFPREPAEVDLTRPQIGVD